MAAAESLAQRRKPGFNLDGSPRKRRTKPKVHRTIGAARLRTEANVHLAEVHAGDPPMNIPKATHETRPSGFPLTSYRPEFCQAVIDFMGQGYTISAFAAEIGVTKMTIRNWAHAHPEFVEAVHVGQVACQKWWEDQLHDVAVKGTHTSGRVTAIVFALKNRGKEDWADIQRVEIGGGFTVAHEDRLDVSRLTLEELVALEQLATKALPAPDPEGAG